MCKQFFIHWHRNVCSLLKVKGDFLLIEAIQVKKKTYGKLKQETASSHQTKQVNIPGSRIKTLQSITLIFRAHITQIGLLCFRSCAMR